MGPESSQVVLGSVCSRLVSPRRRQGVSAVARVQRSGSRLKRSSLVVLGRGSRHRPPRPCLPVCPRAFPGRRSGLAPSRLGAGSLPPPSLSTSSRSTVFPPGALGLRLCPPALLACDPSPLQGLVDDKSVAPDLSEREGFLRVQILADCSSLEARG